MILRQYPAGAGANRVGPLAPALHVAAAVTAVECLQYAMTLPTSVVITGCDSMEVLEQALKAARDVQPLSPERVAALLARTADAARATKFEAYKTTNEHDSTSEHPQWLG